MYVIGSGPPRHFPERRHVARFEQGGNLVDDEARRDRRAVVMQHRHDARRIEIALSDEQRAALRVAVLLDEEDLLVLEHEIDDLVAEGETAYPHRVEMDALLF